MTSAATSSCLAPHRARLHVSPITSLRMHLIDPFWWTKSGIFTVFWFCWAWTFNKGMTQCVGIIILVRVLVTSVVALWLAAYCASVSLHDFSPPTTLVWPHPLVYYTKLKPFNCVWVYTSYLHSDVHRSFSSQTLITSPRYLLHNASMIELAGFFFLTVCLPVEWIDPVTSAILLCLASYHVRLHVSFNSLQSQCSHMLLRPYYYKFGLLSLNELGHVFYWVHGERIFYRKGSIQAL